MSSETEMRRVIEHAADKLAAVSADPTVTCRANHGLSTPQEISVEVLTAITYAEAVLRMLGSYLRVTDPPAGSAQTERGERDG